MKEERKSWRRKRETRKGRRRIKRSPGS